jgi:hypothetical protein
MKNRNLFIFILSVLILASPEAFAQNSDKNKVQYVVIGAHLDTEYLWTLKESINKYIPATLDNNFKLFEKYPGYIFNFEGAFRYKIMKEHYPEKYEKLKFYIEKGNWSVNGAMWEAIDANLPSAESIIRQLLYGNLFFEKEPTMTELEKYFEPSKQGIPYNFLSTHYFVARVFHAAVSVSNKDVRNSEFVKFFSTALPTVGNYSPIQAFLLRKLKGDGRNASKKSLRSKNK